MAILLVMCDPQAEGGLRAAVEAYEDVLPLAETSYLIHTDRTSEEVFDSLKRKLDGNGSDSLLVLTVRYPYVGRAPTDVMLWLERLKEKDLDAFRSRGTPGDDRGRLE